MAWTGSARRGRTAFLLLLGLLAAAAVGCGDDARTTTPGTTAVQTLHVKVSGMVKKLGIT